MTTELVKSIRGTRVDYGRNLRAMWINSEDAECEPLLFADLREGDRFIVMPEPGDNSGHGGLLGGANLFKKIRSFRRRGVRYNTKRLCDNVSTFIPEGMMVLLIE